MSNNRFAILSSASGSDFEDPRVKHESSSPGPPPTRNFTPVTYAPGDSFDSLLHQIIRRALNPRNLSAEDLHAIIQLCKQDFAISNLYRFQVIPLIADLTPDAHLDHRVYYLDALRTSVWSAESIVTYNEAQARRNASLQPRSLSLPPDAFSRVQRRRKHHRRTSRPYPRSHNTSDDDESDDDEPQSDDSDISSPSPSSPTPRGSPNIPAPLLPPDRGSNTTPAPPDFMDLLPSNLKERTELLNAEYYEKALNMDHSHDSAQQIANDLVLKYVAFHHPGIFTPLSLIMLDDISPPEHLAPIADAHFALQDVFRRRYGCAFNRAIRDGRNSQDAHIYADKAQDHYLQMIQHLFPGPLPYYVPAFRPDDINPTPALNRQIPPPGRVANAPSPSSLSQTTSEHWDDHLRPSITPPPPPAPQHTSPSVPPSVDNEIQPAYTCRTRSAFGPTTSLACPYIRVRFATTSHLPSNSTTCAIAGSRVPRS